MINYHQHKIHINQQFTPELHQQMIFIFKNQNITNFNKTTPYKDLTRTVIFTVCGLASLVFTTE